VSARAVRRVVVAVCVVGIAGMIAGSVADDNDVALTFGLLTAAAVACLMVATAVGTGGAGGGAEAPFDEDQARRVEDLVGGLVAGGVEEARVRELVAEAVRLGRGAPPRARVEEEGEEGEGRG
jgi:hypothetical protein